MTERLLSEADLVRVTGKKRYGKQAEWFKATFGIDVVTAANGAVIMTWSTFESLQAKKAGLAGDAPGTRERPALRSVHRAA
ncbi:hypothetical protein WL77_11925 [Burkholderia ubonensis]|uniref:Uncharacterized protein n=1 Tax=Burkholderia ubonensis TaxID=101571 RepID=A0A107GFP7_9BURK|nr:DUF4224 domain-containing protein [Burkholderia ubonensis]KWD81824.1 hypothetical protein WL70_17715 [Burkholderia ubonensis]KWD83784.1 hypothetical protein WL71_15820 [Burkholderia ubonensis]KWE04654.1 hypothetical protein WL72_01080 [Burkholderia ubonensis]KWE11029.1 hypothetical protein WL73_33330 [Burkholderia ubonensis]KWE70508.1 hypothetical protein WL77_11925 [Burkholderia ubonensis]